MSVERGKPEWELLEIPGVKALPAVQRKLENLAMPGTKKRAQLLARLGEVLDTSP